MSLSHFASIPIYDTQASTTTAPTTEAHEQFGSGHFDRIRVLCSYDDVTAATIAIWQWDSTTESWFYLGDSETVDALDPAGQTHEARDYHVGRGVPLHIQVAALATTGDGISVSVLGVLSDA